MKWFLGSISLVLLLAGLLILPARVAGAEGGWTGTVTVPTLNVRSAPNTANRPVGTLHYGDKVTVLATVQGEAAKGDSTWYQIGAGQYVYGPYIARSGGGDVPMTGGRWIDVDLSNKIARAMVGHSAVYTADVTIGRAASRTPVGRFSVVRRVANETMDSSTIGIPRNSPEGYYYTGVLYTQYFLPTGQALHYNYWVPDEAFGNWASSRGCIGLRLADAKYLWDFATVGTPVVVHY